jgi:anti-anti-sigma regulatory factor
VRAKPLEVLHSDADNTEVIVCRGWLRSTECDSLQELIDAALGRRVERLRIQLNETVALDAGVVRCLARTAERCRASGIQLEVIANRRIEQTLAAGGGAGLPIERGPGAVHARH